MSNGTIKNKLVKATRDTGRPGPQCIDLEKFNIHILPAEEQTLSPFEKLYGRIFTLPDLQLGVKGDPAASS